MNAPEPGLSLHDIYVRNDNARRIIAAAGSVLPAASALWNQVDGALADVPALGAVIAAVGRTGRHAHGPCEPARGRARRTRGSRGRRSRPPYHLRDELNARQERPQGHRGAS